MSKRRKFLFALLLTGTAIVAWRMIEQGSRRRLLVENYSQIRIGQHQRDVEVLLGGPPGDFGRYGRWGTTMMTMEGYWGPEGSVKQIWCDDSNRFEIYFDGQGRVVDHHKRAGYDQSPPENFGRVLAYRLEATRPLNESNQMSCVHRYTSAFDAPPIMELPARGGGGAEESQKTSSQCSAHPTLRNRAIRVLQSDVRFRSYRSVVQTGW